MHRRISAYNPRSFPNSLSIAYLGRAVGLEVTRLLATVADTFLAHLLWTVFRDMSKLSAIVALRTLSAVTAHVTVSTTAVALHLTVTESASATIATSLWRSTLETASRAALEPTGRGGILAVTGDMPLATALVAFSTIHTTIDSAVT